MSDDEYDVNVMGDELEEDSLDEDDEDSFDEDEDLPLSDEDDPLMGGFGDDDEDDE